MLLLLLLYYSFTFSSSKKKKIKQNNQITHTTNTAFTFTCHSLSWDCMSRRGRLKTIGWIIAVVSKANILP